jgi:hypothetical protein
MMGATLLHEYVRLLIEGSLGSGRLVIVDVQPEYRSFIGFDVGKLLQNALEKYSEILVLWNGPNLSMCTQSELVGYLFEEFSNAGGDEDDFERLIEKCTFYDKGYGFFRDLLDHPCFNEEKVTKIVRYMIDKGISDIRELTSDDVEQIGVSELLVDDLEDYGFYVPDLKDELPRWSGSHICGGSVAECLAEVEVLASAMGLNFKRLPGFTY